MLINLANNQSVALTTTATGDTTSMLFTIVPIVLMLVVLYFIMIRPQQKKDKQTATMRNSIEVGDTVTTIGGILGIVSSIKEDTFVLETGADRVKLRFKRDAIYSVEKLVVESPSDANKEKAAKDAKK